MRIVRYGLLAGAALFGLLVAARAILGPLSFPVAVRGPINIESFCGVFLMLALAIRTGTDQPASLTGTAVSPACIAALLVLLAAAFWRAIGIYFLADDFVLVQVANDFRLADVRGLLMTPEGNAFFRPFLHFFMAFAATWAKFDPRLWHVTSLILHALNSVLVLVLAARLGLSRSAAFFAGALFAIHGSLPESVVWIAGEYGLLSTFFVLCGLLALLAYLRDDLQANSRWRWGLAAASLVCMVLAFITKESAYVFPLVAGLLVISKRVPPRRARILLLFLIVAIFLFMYRWSLLGGIGGYRDDNSGARLFAEVGVLQVVRSLLLRLWAVLYFPINWSQQPGVVPGVASAAYVAALLVVSFQIGKNRTRCLPLLFPLGLLCLAALPPIQQLLIGSDLQKSRALYLPSVGFALLLATAMEPLERRARWIVPSAILLFHFAALQHNLTFWKRTGEIARQTCVATAQCAFPKVAKLEIWNMPGSLDGVYFLGVGFNECVKMQTERSLPQAEFHIGDPPAGQDDTALLLWDKMNSDLRCVREGKK